MKRILSSLFALLILSSLCSPVFAAKAKMVLDPDVAATIHGQLTSEELADFANTELYNSSMEGMALNGQPVLKIHLGALFYTTDNSLENLLTLETGFNVNQYVVLGEKPYQLVQFKETKKIGVNASFEEALPTYVADLYTLSKTMTLNGQECTLQGVYCFNLPRAATETAVYLQTDKGVFVKYYADDHMPCQLFTEAELVEYAKNYIAYLTSDEVNYDENGELLGGGSVTFSEFVKMDCNRLWMSRKETSPGSWLPLPPFLHWPLWSTG